MILYDIIYVLIFISPVVIAGVIHVVFIKCNFLPSLKRPIDFGSKISDIRVFGDNKTWRGVMVMTFFSALVSIFLYEVGIDHIQWIGFMYYQSFWESIIIGIAMGLAYSLGELPNSFLKRRLGFDPGYRPRGLLGKIFYFIDQADSVMAIVLVLWIICNFSPRELLLILTLGTSIHILIDALLYVFKIKKPSKT